MEEIRSRYYQVIEMTVIALHMQYSGFMELIAGRKIFVVSYKVVKINFGRSADHKYDQ